MFDLFFVEGKAGMALSSRPEAFRPRCYGERDTPLFFSVEIRVAILSFNIISFFETVRYHILVRNAARC